MTDSSCISYQLLIYPRKTECYQVDPVDGVQLTRGLDCIPARLNFKVPKDDKLSFLEGNLVDFKVGDAIVFRGIVFEKSRDKENVISVVAYDQMRYLKYKDAFVYYDWTAQDLIKNICKDRQLTTGDLANTVYKIPRRVEDNKTYADMIMFALNQTLINTKIPYHCYDDAGKIVLKKIDDMQLDILIDVDVMENYSYKTSIDRDTYNVVKVVKEVPGEKGKQLAKVAYAEDEDHIKEWGALQYYLKADDNMVNVPERAKNLLELKNRKTRQISFKGVIGDIRVRGGSMVFVQFNFGDVTVKNYMMVTGVTHHFSQNYHSMDLDVLYVEKPKGATKTYANNELLAANGKGTGNLSVDSGLKAGYDAWGGCSMNHGGIGCTEAVVKVGSYYSPFLAKECENGVADADVLMADAKASGVSVVDYSGAQGLSKGDVIIYNNAAGETQHAVIYDGQGGYVGNSTSQGVVVKGSDYTEMGEGLYPAKVIKTSQG